MILWPIHARISLVLLLVENSKLYLGVCFNTYMTMVFRSAFRVDGSTWKQHLSPDAVDVSSNVVLMPLLLRSFWVHSLFICDYPGLRGLVHARSSSFSKFHRSKHPLCAALSILDVDLSQQIMPNNCEGLSQNGALPGAL